jgi:hypothetical protein
MTWTEFLTGNNTNTEIQNTYFHWRTITRDEVTVGSVSNTNLALGKSVVVSSTESGTNTANKAVDGSTGTRWSSAYTDQNWIYVDLGASKSVSKVVLNWEASYAKKFQIQVSNDQSTWTTVYTNEAATGGTNTISFTPVAARYVKMFAYQRATTYGYSLWEFQVF